MPASFVLDQGGGQPYKYVLILISSHTHLSRFLSLVDVVEDRMFRLCTAIKTLLERRLPAMMHISLLLW